MRATIVTETPIGGSLERVVSCPDCQGCGYDVVWQQDSKTGEPIEEQIQCGLCNAYGQITLAAYDEWCKLRAANNRI